MKTQRTHPSHGLVYLLEPELQAEYGPHVNDEIRHLDRLMVKVANEVYDETINDYEGFGQSLSPRSLKLVAANARQSAPFFGRFIEDRVHHRLMKAPEFARSLQRFPAIEGTRGLPDWGHIFIPGTYWDLTTPKQVDQHAARPGYGPNLRILVYERSPHFADLIIDSLAWVGLPLNKSEQTAIREWNQFRVDRQKDLVEAQRRGDWAEIRYLAEVARLQKRAARTERSIEWHQNDLSSTNQRIEDMTVDVPAELEKLRASTQRISPSANARPGTDASLTAEIQVLLPVLRQYNSQAVAKNFSGSEIDFGIRRHELAKTIVDILSSAPRVVPLLGRDARAALIAETSRAGYPAITALHEIALSTPQQNRSQAMRAATALSTTPDEIGLAG